MFRSSNGRGPWALLLLALLLAGRPVDAQLSPVGGSISGRVFDAQGVNLEEVEVLVVGERRFRTTSDRWGYRFDHLPPDTYSVEVSTSGYVTSAVESVEVWVGDSLRIDFRLREGSPNAVSVTSMPIIDTTTAGAAYRLFDPPLGSLPVSGTLASIERLLPQESELVTTTSLTVDGAAVMPAQTPDFALWRPTLGRLAGELFESVDLFGSRVDPRIRTLDSLQLMTRTTTAEWHGNFGVRWSGEAADGGVRTGEAERQRLIRPHAAMLFPVGDRFRVFAGLADHGGRVRPVSLGGSLEDGTLDGVTTRRDDDTTFVRLNGGPLGPALELRASFLEVQSEEDTGRGAQELSSLVTGLRRWTLRLNRFSGRFGTLAQINDRRALTSWNRRDERRTRTRDVALSVDTLLARHFIVLGVSRERTDGDLLAPPSTPFEGPFGGGGAAGAGLQLERYNLHASNRWRATENIAVEAGLRIEQLDWSGSGSPAIRRGDETWWLPRLGVAWDVFGNGQWALLLSGGREMARQVAIYDIGLAPFLQADLAPTERVQVDAFGLASRYQLFPGLLIETEIGRRRFADDEEQALRPVAEEEGRFRVGVEARISRRWQARALYELRDLGTVRPGIGQAAPPAELGTTQRSHLHVVRRFDSGWVLSGLLEYVDEHNVAMRALGEVVEVPRESVAPRASLAQVDLMAEYRFDHLPRIPFLGNEPPELVWRIEVLNVLDRRSEAVAVPDVFVGPGTEGLLPYPTLSAAALGSVAGDPDLVTATRQAGRRIWIGFDLEL